MTKKLLLLPGDGIGPEVTAQTVRVAEYLMHKEALDLTIEEGALGGAAIDIAGVPIEQATLDRALAADAVLLGAVGGLKWADLPYDKRPEAGLLKLRDAMGVFANLRPILCFSALASESTLKPQLVENLDIMFVRELVGGIYFGEPRGIEDLGNGSRRGVNTQVYTTQEIRRVAKVAFELARTRGKRLCSVEKSNVMESGLLWREEVTKLGADDYPDIELTHMYADNCAMQLVREPKQFDVILTDNLFGDILSDAAAMLTGSLGMLPSAALGVEGSPGLFEPIHGSAPDIAGKGIANPCASILSFAMMLRWAFERPDLAVDLEKAISGVLDAGYRTQDLSGDSEKVSTEEMGEAILNNLENTKARGRNLRSND